MWGSLYIYNQITSSIYFSNLLFSAAKLPGFTFVHYIYHFVYCMLTASGHSHVHTSKKIDRQAVCQTSAELTHETDLGAFPE